MFVERSPVCSPGKGVAAPSISHSRITAIPSGGINRIPRMYGHGSRKINRRYVGNQGDLRKLYDTLTLELKSSREITLFDTFIFLHFLF